MPTFDRRNVPAAHYADTRVMSTLGRRVRAGTERCWWPQGSRYASSMRRVTPAVGRNRHGVDSVVSSNYHY